MLKILTIKESTKKYKNFRYENYFRVRNTGTEIVFFNTAYPVMFVFSLVEII